MTKSWEILDIAKEPPDKVVVAIATDQLKVFVYCALIKTNRHRLIIGISMKYTKRVFQFCKYDNEEN